MSERNFEGVSMKLKQYTILVLLLNVISFQCLAQEGHHPKKSTEKVMATSKEQVATFGGGCFWCMESAFDKVNGVKKNVVGYSGGQAKSPTYKQVSAGGTGHAEVLQVTFDLSVITYEQLLDVFWKFPGFS